MSTQEAWLARSDPAPPKLSLFHAEIISHAVWLYFRFPLGLRMVEELLAARGIIVSHETVRQWARKFGQQFANQIRRRLPRTGDKWHLDEGAPLLTAAAERLPPAILDQIKPRGRIVLPLGSDEAQWLTVIDKGADGQTVFGN